MTETVAAFERHLLDNLDDVAAWSAYADYLTEQGEPRGDFMRVQLALEDESLPKAERRALQEEEEALRVKHLDEWVGASFAAENFDAEGRAKHERIRFAFRRGWLWKVRNFHQERGTVTPTRDWRGWRWVHTAQVNTCRLPLAGTPLTRNLRSLCVGSDELRGERPRFAGLPEFVGAASRLERFHLSCVRADLRGVFGLPLPRLRRLSVRCEGRYPAQTLAENPELSSLRTLALKPYGFVSWDYGVATLAEVGITQLTADDVRALAYSAHLKRLRHLVLNFLSAGDQAVDILVNSGMIYRLKSLDLCHGQITDAGTFTLFKALHETPHALDTLKLNHNALSGDGIAALRRLKLTLDAPDQHAPGDDEYQTQGDFE